MKKCILMLLCTIQLVPFSYAESSNSDEILKDLQETSYCGICCVQFLSKAHGGSLGFSDLLRNDYVISKKGSTIVEMERALSKCGLHYISAKNISLYFLKRTKNPVILHVKNDPASRKYDHYIVFLGYSHGQAILFDPFHGVVKKSLNDLLPIWDKKGIIVSDATLTKLHVFGPIYIFYLCGFIVIAGIILCINYYLKKWLSVRMIFRTIGNYYVQALFIFCFAATLGMSSNIINNRIISKSLHSDNLIKAYQSCFIKKLDRKGLEDRLAGGVLLIDARSENLFKAGHIPKSKNCFAGNDMLGFQSDFPNIEFDTNIIVYGENENDGYATMLAEKLAENGYRNVTIYKEGWKGWLKYER